MTRKVVFLRHAQSSWNLENRFSGWADVGLTESGVQEAREAARLLMKAGHRFDRAYTSRLKRAEDTLSIVLREMQHPPVPIERDWRLNERHYGALEGLNKQAIAEQYGQEQFQRWRRGYADRPPMLGWGDGRHPRFDARYMDVETMELPTAESLADVSHRLVPYWEVEIVPRIHQGEQVLIVSHGNTLRALVKYLEHMDDREVERLEIPTARPLVYEFDEEMRIRTRYRLENDAPQPHREDWSPGVGSPGPLPAC